MTRPGVGAGRHPSLRRVLLIALAGVLALAAGRIFGLGGKRVIERVGGEAPRDKRLMLDVWAPGQKDGFGTAYTYGMDPPASRVWFTLADGAVTEVYYPTLDSAVLAGLRFVVSDGRSFASVETDWPERRVGRPERSLRYTVVSGDPARGFQLTKTVLTDPERDALVLQVRFEGRRGQRLYAYLDPRLVNGGAGNSAEVREDAALAWGDGTYLALLADAPFQGRWAGFKGNSDGFRELLETYRPGPAYDRALDGRVAILIDLGAPDREFGLALGFGPGEEEALAQARGALSVPADELVAAFDRGWSGYLSGLVDWPARAERAGLAGERTASLYWGSVMVMKAAEDKTYPGAGVASPSHPWGEQSRDEPNFRGYRLVWPRDLYHTSMAFLAAGDRGSAEASLAYLIKLQRPDGTFPQNVYLDGRAYWQSLQLDEVADVVLLAWWLDRADLAETVVRKALEAIVRLGPATPQERWEEASGYSPATIAAEIAALVAGADLLERAAALPDGPRLRQDARRFLATADDWRARLDAWSVTRTGSVVDGPYFLRISPTGRPDEPARLTIANGGQTVDQRSVVDPSFLELVRLGVRSPEDPVITNSLRAADTLRVETPNGPSWYRYTGDRYGDSERAWGNRQGRLWVLLTGERGNYELAAGRRDEAVALLRSMERFASPGGMLSEQIWEATGTGTGSATPLIWSHAEYVVLLASVVEGRVVDTPEVVRARFAREGGP